MFNKVHCFQDWKCDKLQSENKILPRDLIKQIVLLSLWVKKGNNGSAAHQSSIMSFSILFWSFNFILKFQNPRFQFRTLMTFLANDSESQRFDFPFMKTVTWNWNSNCSRFVRYIANERGTIQLMIQIIAIIWKNQEKKVNRRS